MSNINYPLLSEYEIAIKKEGNSILNIEEKYGFIPNKTSPIKFFNFGSGSFAGVFKIRSLENSKTYALRCFFNGGDPNKIDRTKKIIEHLSNINEYWICKSQIFERGIYVKNYHYPAIVMEWANGIPINDFVSSILYNNADIDNLQRKLVELNHNLESKDISHGDIQSGNLFISKIGNTVTIKLLDYDAMYIPSLKGQQATETGHSSFQHPTRTKAYYNSTIDRFSFWLMLTALEALKFDKRLWNKDMNGGFNDEDNFLFKAKDISNPESSDLVSRLRNLQQPSIDYYLSNLFSDRFLPQRNKLTIFSNNEGTSSNNPPLKTTSINETSSNRTNPKQNIDKSFNNSPQQLKRTHLISQVSSDKSNIEKSTNNLPFLVTYILIFVIIVFVIFSNM